MYLYVFTYFYIHIYIYTYTCTYACVYICMNGCTHVYVLVLGLWLVVCTRSCQRHAEAKIHVLRCSTLSCDVVMNADLQKQLTNTMMPSLPFDSVREKVNTHIMMHIVGGHVFDCAEHMAVRRYERWSRNVYTSYSICWNEQYDVGRARTGYLFVVCSHVTRTY